MCSEQWNLLLYLKVIEKGNDNSRFTIGSRYSNDSKEMADL